MGYSFVPSGVTPAYIRACCYDNYLQQQTCRAAIRLISGQLNVRGFLVAWQPSDLEDTVLTQKKKAPAVLIMCKQAASDDARFILRAFLFVPKAPLFLIMPWV